MRHQRVTCWQELVSPEIMQREVIAGSTGLGLIGSRAEGTRAKHISQLISVESVS